MAAEKVRQIFSIFPNRVLLLPSTDREESVQVLLELNRKYKLTLLTTSSEAIKDIHNYVLNSNTVYSLATIVIYTKGKSIESICSEVLANIQSPGTTK